MNLHTPSSKVEEKLCYLNRNFHFSVCVVHYFIVLPRPSILLSFDISSMWFRVIVIAFVGFQDLRRRKLLHDKSLVSIDFDSCVCYSNTMYYLAFDQVWMSQHGRAGKLQ